MVRVGLDPRFHSVVARQLRDVIKVGESVQAINADALRAARVVAESAAAVKNLAPRPSLFPDTNSWVKDLVPATSRLLVVSEASEQTCRTLKAVTEPYRRALELHSVTGWHPEMRRLTEMARIAAPVPPMTGIVPVTVDVGVLTGLNSMIQSVAQAHQRVTEMARWALRPEWAELTDMDHVLRVLLLGAAERARDDYLSSGGDLRVVEDFAFDWLGLRPAPRFRETTLNAVVDVLLSETWGATTTSAAALTHEDLRNSLRTGVASAHRLWKPIWENKICRNHIGSLNTPRPLPHGDTTDVGLLVPDDVDVEAIALDRAMLQRGPGHQTLEELSPEERNVAVLAAEGRNWSAAAEEAGLSKADGQRIHRKAKRLARKFIVRQLERDRTLADEEITLR